MTAGAVPGAGAERNIPAQRTLPSRLVIATRSSALAVWQAEHVRQRLRAQWPGLAVDLLKLSTRGDEVLDRSLAKIGGKGLFVKELESALLDGRADLAVHSLKDVPVDLSLPFVLAAVLERADPRDAFVSERYASLAEVPVGGVIGTSSLRRQAQLQAGRPDLRVEPLRGNVNTRLSKLDSGQFDAIILAAAGLDRLGLGGRIRARLSPEQSLPAAGQGALGIEALAARADVQALLAPLRCEQAERCTLAEREVSLVLGGSCQVPLAAYAVEEGGRLWLRALLASPDGQQVVRAQGHDALDQAQALGQRVAQALFDAGARAILDDIAPVTV